MPRRKPNLKTFDQLTQAEKDVVNAARPELSGYGYTLSPSLEYTFDLRGLNVDEVRSFFDVDYTTGKIFSKVKRGRGKAAVVLGEEIKGSPIKGKPYRVVCFTFEKKVVTCYLHHIVFFTKYGFLPTEIDHYNGNGFDDAINNLRPATRQENQRNMSFTNRSKTGIVNIFHNVAGGKDRWVFVVGPTGDKVYRTVDTLLEAIESRNAYRELHGFAPARDNVKDAFRDVYNEAVAQLNSYPQKLAA